MSFPRAAQEIQSLERRLEELSRAGRGKDLEIARLLKQESTTNTSSSSIDQLCSLLQTDGDKVKVPLSEFVDDHQSFDHGMNVLASFGAEAHGKLVEAIVKRLQRLDNNEEDVVVDLLRLVRGMTRESRQNCQGFADNLLALFITRVQRKISSRIREASARCIHTLLVQNPELRAKLINNEQTIDALTGCLEEIAALIRNPDESCNAECARLFVTVKALFTGTNEHGDKLVARMLLRSGFVSAAVERMSCALMEVVDVKTRRLNDSAVPLLSTTQEGIARGAVLLDGFRFLYVTAIFADEELLAALLRNEDKPILQGEDLERCELDHPNLGLGDRYVFLQTHVALVTAPAGCAQRDVDNLDMIKISVCSLLMFANRAPGFVAYLFRRGVGPCLFQLLDRETTRAKMPGGSEDELLSILIAIKTLVDDNEDFKEQFQDLFFERLLPEIDPTEYATQEEFNKAAEQRHYAGRSIPDTVFGKVVKLLTSFHDHVKRYAGELLFFLCDDDAKKVTALVGFGHAAHILAIKGGMLGQMGGA